MNFLCWNARGLGNQIAFRALKRKNDQQASNLVFLMETRLNKGDDDRIKRDFGFDGVLEVPHIKKPREVSLLSRPAQNLPRNPK